MSMIFKFPDVGEGIHEGKVVQWLVAEGDSVETDQPLVKVETDKAVVELPAPEAGAVLKLHVSEGQVVTVGEPLVSLGEAGEKPAQAAATGEAVVPEPTKDKRDKPSQEEAPTAPSSAEKMRQRLMRPPATPHTRALARELGVDLESVKGTGPGGRIADDDVERAYRGEKAASRAEPAPVSQKPHAAVPSVSPERPEREERVPMTHLRKVISDAMTTSKRTSAHVTHVDEADVTDLVAYYQALKGEVQEKWGVRLTLLPFFVKSLTAALKDHPLLNASLDEEHGEIVLKHYYNIGIAVDTSEGLIVPVVKDADQKSIVTLAGEISDLAERARNRTLNLDEIKGATCTITNVGPLGGVFATPIIHQPELAILGLHAIKDRTAVVDGEIAIRKLMYLSISFDHRVIDGAEAARFMTDLVKIVSDPKQLLVRL
jgi:pyruvate/2-oxoglutarate dehydrogenase complex dihydrolipoamide acyltransferase (E2) component